MLPGRICPARGEPRLERPHARVQEQQQNNNNTRTEQAPNLLSARTSVANPGIVSPLKPRVHGASFLLAGSGAHIRRARLGDSVTD